MVKLYFFCGAGLYGAYREGGKLRRTADHQPGRGNVVNISSIEGEVPTAGSPRARGDRPEN